MTVSKDYNKHVYAGNGLTTEWPYDFELPLKADNPDSSLIQVYLTDPSGIISLLTEGYWVDVGNGRIIYPYNVPGADPLPVGWKITLVRHLPISQQFLDLSNQANLYPETIETAIDRLVMILQQVNETTGRAVQYPIDSVETGDTLLADILAASSAAQVAATAAGASETNASTSEMAAKASENASSISAGEAKVSEKAAKVSEDNALASENNAKTAEAAAKASETKAKVSETSAGLSEANAKTSETAARTSETNAKASEVAAKASEDNALTYANSVNPELLQHKAEKDQPGGYAGLDTGGKVAKAIQADQVGEKLAADVVIKNDLNAPGDAPYFVCRAWVHFNGANNPPIIHSQGNISSIIRQGAGIYTINFLNPMVDAHYVCSVASGGFMHAILEGATANSVSVSVKLANGADGDSVRTQIAIFR